jgi:translation initiation factor 1
VADEKRPFHNPFAALKPMREAMPSPEPPALEPVAPSPAPRSRGIRRAVVRMERSGRGGKEVTVVEQLDIPSTDREAWLRTLKSALGCGGTVEGNAVVLQGDHRKRLPAILTARGVKKVTVS